MMVGFGNTMKVYAGAIIPALVVGMLLGIIKARAWKPLRMLIGFYTWAWRGTPLLLQLLIMKYGLPSIGIQTEDFLGSIVVFALNMGAYVTEIMRASIESVEQGQYEACKALCIPSTRTMFRVIIPQSIRIGIPPACSEAINLIKDTAVLYIIGYQDFLRVADQVAGRDGTIIPYLFVFVVYLILTSIMLKIFNMIEKKVTAHD